ncbi:MAG: ABC transporter permease subunit, partial [Holdemania massiliensis]
PVLGEMFFKQVHPTFYLTIVLVFVTWYVVFKTPFGLRMRSCGEFPQASASMGINVRRMRYFGVLVSGALAGLAGGVMVLTQDVQFTVVTVHGFGFIAIAALILASGIHSAFWVRHVLRLLPDAGLLCQGYSVLATLPTEFFSMFPYVLTIIALVILPTIGGPRHRVKFTIQAALNRIG